MLPTSPSSNQSPPDKAHTRGKHRFRIHIPPSLHHRRYFLLWLGLLISITGSQMQVWAVLWQIRTLTDQPIALGGVGLARIIPVIVFSLIGGAFADVHNRRHILFITQSGMAIVALILGWLSLTGNIDLWHIYLLMALQAVAMAFNGPALQSLVPNLVPGKDLPNAFSMNSIANQVGSIVGPALSGIVIAAGELSYVYIINAISFMAVIVALFLMGPVEQQKTAGAKNGKVSVTAIAEGVRFILNQPLILSTMILDFFATFFASANTLMPIIARDVLHVGAVAYGWLSSAQAIGAMVAALVISQMHQIRRQGMIFLSAVIVFGAATIFFGFSRSFILAMLALIVIGGADTVSTIIRNTIRQLSTPDYIRGRMTSVNQIFFQGGPQLGEVEAGLVAQITSAPIAIITGGIGCIVATIWIARRWPQIRTYNGDEPIAAGKSAP
ncbi:MAG: MFS transporter [Anaerolineales bacterium]|nr:MAG: MFS transporter [Anaerolineales bacterium]